MKNILFTTLFAGCFAVSSVFAGEAASKSDGFTFGVKISTGVASAKNLKTKNVTYGTSAKIVSNKAQNNKEGTKQNTKKKSSPFLGITFGTKYHFNDQFALGADIFYDAMNVKFELKEKTKGLDDTAKIRGSYGLMAVFAYNPFEKMSFELGAGIAKITKIKGVSILDLLNISENIKYVDVFNSVKFKEKIGLVVKVGVNYAFNDNVSLGLDVKMQQVKSYTKEFKLGNAIVYEGEGKFKSRLYTIGATLTYKY